MSCHLRYFISQRCTLLSNRIPSITPFLRSCYILPCHRFHSTQFIFSNATSRGIPSITSPKDLPKCKPYLLSKLQELSRQQPHSNRKHDFATEKASHTTKDRRRHVHSEEQAAMETLFDENPKQKRTDSLVQQQHQLFKGILLQIVQKMDDGVIEREDGVGCMLDLLAIMRNEASWTTRDTQPYYLYLM
uniref:Uncharacterized protein n=1 Tax=Percolomonas cosmopolitus TaxID=63605 RepID=A0A7S1KRJ7_9EUKA